MVDFQELLKQLQDKGWSLQALADHAQVSKGAIAALRNGRNLQPRYDAGDRLVQLAYRELRKAPQR